MKTPKNVGDTKTIVENSLAKHEAIKHGATSRLTSLGPLIRPKYPQELQRPKAMQRTYKLHKLMRHFSPRCSRTTPWRWRISRQLHKPTEYRSRCSQGQYLSHQARSINSTRNSQQHKPRTPGFKNRDIGQLRLSMDIRCATTWHRQIQTQSKIKMCTPELDRSSTLTGTDPPTDTTWRRHTRLQRVAYPGMVTTIQLRD